VEQDLHIPHVVGFGDCETDVPPRFEQEIQL
jgi:hypothetical protein